MSLGFGLAYTLFVLLLLVVASLTLAWMLYAWRSADADTDTDTDTFVSAPQRTTGRQGRDGAALSFSLLVPARHEERVLGRTLDRLASIEHEDFEIIVIVGHDDPGTAAVAAQAGKRYPERVRVVVDTNPVKNKPRALNSALPECRKDVIAVFDAEDVVHPGLLTAVESRMLQDGTVALQSGVQLMNFESNWFSVHNVLEYYFWFRSRLHFQARRGFIPLGGNTVFVRRNLLELLQGWDGDCLAEDCDLGVRLSSHGFAVSVMYDPELVTQEETPVSLDAFMRQRTRWNQGFIQVLLKRDWRMLPTRSQRILALYTLNTPFFQAFAGLLVPLAILTMALAVLPAGLAVFSFLPILPAMLTLAVQHLALREFGRIFDRRTRIRDHLRLTLGTPLFQLVLSYAAVRAVVREIRGHGGWEKTAHVGVHLGLEEPRSEAVA